MNLEQKAQYNKTLMQNNKIILEQTEHGVFSSKVLWEKPFYCIEEGCQEKTHLTRRINMSIVAKMLGQEPTDFYQPLCEKHWELTHAVGLVEISKMKKEDGELP